MTRASSLLFWFVLTIAASAALYNTSYRVQNLRQQVHALNAQIEAEQINIHVLKAEWVFLANPARIEEEARKHLALQPTAPKQIARIENLPELLPARAEQMAKAPAAEARLAQAAAQTDRSASAKAAAPLQRTAMTEDLNSLLLAHAGSVP
jgi:cell division protein FtsL